VSPCQRWDIGYHTSRLSRADCLCSDATTPACLRASPDSRCLEKEVGSVAPPLGRVVTARTMTDCFCMKVRDRGVHEHVREKFGGCPPWRSRAPASFGITSPTRYACCLRCAQRSAWRNGDWAITIRTSATTSGSRKRALSSSDRRLRVGPGERDIPFSCGGSSWTNPGAWWPVPFGSGTSVRQQRRGRCRARHRQRLLGRCAA
jgi:hypothetical protein